MRCPHIVLSLAVLCCAQSARAADGSSPTTTATAPPPAAATRPATEIRRGIEMTGPREERARRVYEDIIRQVEPSLAGDPARLPQYLALFNREFVEDPRQFALDVRAERDGADGRIVLTGHAEYAEHRRALLTFLGHLGFANVDDRIESLPAPDLGAAPVALVRAERCFLYSRPAAPRETVTEAAAGEPVFLLKDTGDGTFLAHGADGYVGYIDAAAIERVSADAFLARLSPPRAEPDERIERAIAAAHAMLGTPYVWGGRTAAGVDCSGLVQSAYRAAGVNLPRDADQQSLTGRLAATRAFRAGLGRGDVLFFLGRRGTVSHTAIYLGDDQMIEATSPVARVSSFNPAHENYSRQRADSFCFAKRMVD